MTVQLGILKIFHLPVMTVFDDDSLKMQNILEQKTDKTLKVKVMA